MKKAILFVLFCSFVTFPAFAFANSDSYYVTQNGSGSRSGLSESNAWNVSDFNNSGNWSSTDQSGKIDPGDIVFFSGKIWDRVIPKGSGNSEGYIVLDGFKDGNCDPLNSECTSSAEINGGLRLDSGQDYIKIQDFRVTTQTLEVQPYFGDDISEYIEISRNYIHDANVNLLVLSNGVVGNKKARYIKVDGNKIVNFGKTVDAAQGFNIVSCEHTIVSNNVIGHTPPDVTTSANMIEVHGSQNLLFEYNDIYGAPEQSGLGIKEHGSQDIVVRYNKLRDNDGPSGRGLSINWPTTQRIYVYGNAIYGNGDYGIDIFDAAHHVYIWSNIIYDHPQRGIITWWGGESRMQGWSYDPIHELYIINNIFVNNGYGITGSAEVSWTGLALGAPSTSTVVKNNIFDGNRPNGSSYQQIWVGSPAVNGTILEHNQYYLDGKTPTIYWNNTQKTVNQLQAIGLENRSPKGEVLDPVFIKTEYNDFISAIPDSIEGGAEIQETLPTITVYDQLINLSYNIALDKDKINWGPGIAKSEPVIRSFSSTTWKRGAYDFQTINNNSIYPPQGVRLTLN